MGFIKFEKMKKIVLYFVFVSFVYSCKGGRAAASIHQDVSGCTVCLNEYFTPVYYEKLKDFEQYIIDAKLVDEISYSEINRFVRKLKINQDEKARVGMVLKKYGKEPIGLSEFYALKSCCERTDSNSNFCQNVHKFYDADLSDSSMIAFLNTIGPERFNGEKVYRGVFLFTLEWHLSVSFAIAQKNKKQEKEKE